VLDDGEVVRVDQGDHEGDDGVSSVVFGVGKDDELGCSEREFLQSQYCVQREETHGQCDWTLTNLAGHVVVET
jgi:hypothetical protein